MNFKAIVLSVALALLPSVALALPAAGEFSIYWSEPELRAHIKLDDGSYEISGRYVAVLTLEERPQAGTHALVGELYDCSESQYVVSARVEYDLNNNEISSYSSDNLRKSFGPIDEDSRQEFVFIGVCNDEKRMPYDLAKVREYFKMIAESVAATECPPNR